MTFSRKYIIWLLVPPAIVLGPLSYLFLAQIVRMSLVTAGWVFALFAFFFAVGGVALWRGLAPLAEAVDDNVRRGEDASDAASRCLERTETLTLLVWGAGSILYALLAAFLVMPTALGFGYFLVSALTAALFFVIWAYAAGKRLLVERASHGGALRYSGRQLPLGRKIAIVFIGSFLVSITVLVSLISSKVSTTLEELAISSSSDRFQRVFDSANLAATIDPSIVDTLREYVPSDYAIVIIPRRGAVRFSTPDALTPAEVELIRWIGDGDSSAFISPHVCRFARLKDGSILVLTIPWAQYKNIPRQITFYMIVIALFTMAVFIAAAFFLSNDVARPLHAIDGLAADMARGDFNTTVRVFSDDEVGRLASSFDETRANLRRLLGRVGGSGSTITEGVGVITGGIESLLLRSRDQATLTESSLHAVENVRGGIGGVLGAADTVTTLTQDASSRALELQASSEEVARSMDHLFQSVEKTSASVTEMNASMLEMSKRTDVLAGIGDEALSFVAEMDSTIVELQASAQSTADISRQVREDAEAGGGAMAKTVEGINISRDVTNSTAETLDELQRTVGQISQILNVIEEITNRTNLLALNAAIIAAQAGEHGRGFTVVADEIRQLAERTRGSTKEISAIVKAVQSGSQQAATKMREGVKRVVANVQLADDASASLAKIVGSASRSYEMATKISRALEEQARASVHLHEVTSRTADHISEINRASREQARGTQLLAEEAERVREIAGQVKNATDEQSQAGRGISAALERISEDARAMRDSLERQLRETDRIADASRTMLEIARANDAIARQFDATVQNLVTSGSDFESEVSRFRVTGEK